MELNYKKLIYPVLFICFIIISCSESAKLTKIANGYEEQGEYRLAAESYFDALEKDENNEKAKEGIKRNAYKVLEDYLNKFTNYYDFEEYEKSYDAYIEALEYKNKISKANIVLRIGKNESNKFEQNKEILANKYYNLGVKDINAQKWQNAIENLLKAKEIKPKFRDLNKQLAEAYYQKGMKLYNSKSYRNSYYQFENCINCTSNYKDAESYKNKSFDLGKITIGIFPFINNTSLRDFGEDVCYSMIHAFKDYESPFIIVKSYISSKNIDEKDIKRGNYSNTIDIALVGKIGEEKETSKLKKLKGECYEIYYEKDENGIKKKKGRKTYWYYHTQNRKIKIEIDYSLVDTKKQQTISSGSFYLTKDDEIEYGTYPGEKFLGYLALEQWDPDAKVGTVLLDTYRELKAIGSEDFIPFVGPKFFTARQELLSFEEMTRSFYYKISDKISESLCPLIDTY